MEAGNSLAVKKVNILLIEDNPLDQILFQEMLREVHEEAPYRTVFHVTWAQTFHEGLGRASNGSWEAIVSDFRLPDTPADGARGLVRRLVDVATGAPVILLSGIHDEQTAAEAIQQGAQDYLVKGEFTPNLLVRTINHAIERKRMERRQAGLASLELTSSDPQQLQATLEKICELTARELPATGGACLLLWDAESETLTPTAEHGLMAFSENARSFLSCLPTPLEKMIREQKLLVEPDILASPGPLHPEVSRSGLRAFIGAPLVYEGKTRGLLFALDRRPRRYRPADIDFIVDLAQRGAAAIARVQLFEQERYERKLAETLRSVSNTLNASLSLGRVLEQLLRSLGRLIDYDDAVVLLTDEPTSSVIESDVYLLDHETRKHWVELEAPARLLKRFENRRKVLHCQDLHDCQDYLAPRTQKGRSWIGAPLVHHDRLIGLLVVMHNEPNAYTERDADAVQALADQATIAITNACLYEQTRVALASTDALYSAAQSLIMPLRLREVLRTVADGARRAVGADIVTIVRLDVEDRQVLSYTKSGGGIDALDTVTFDEMWSGLTGWVIRTGRSAYSKKNSPDPRESYAVQRRRLETNAGSIIVAPLVFRGEILGTMTAINAPERPDFSQHDVRLMEAMANQAAMAIQHADLFEKTQRLANMDSLTGLHTRRRFFELGHQVFASASQFDQPLTAMMIDVDRFKIINDEFGHAVGDAVLTRVAQRAQAQLRRTDILGRYGGEEFAVLLPNTELPFAWTIAERLRSAIEDTQDWGADQPLSVTISLGIAERTTQVQDLNDLLRAADHALYAAKNRGRNQVAVWPDLVWTAQHLEPVTA